MLAQRTDNADLVALSKRDLAIAYSYAGDLDDAERYAREALASSPKAPEQVFAPAHKVLGDIALRRGDPQAAIAEYGQALDTASARYRPLVLLSVASAQIAAGDAVGARKTLDAAGPPATGELASSYRRIEGNLLLAEGKPEEARRVFSELLTQSGSGDANYDRLWAHEGIGPCGPRARRQGEGAGRVPERGRRFGKDSRPFSQRRVQDRLVRRHADAYSRRRSNSSAESGDYETAWNLSERSRARALLDVVRNRIDAGVDNQQLNGQVPSLAVVRGVLKPDEAIVEFHILDKSLLAWVIRPNGLTGYTLPIARTDLETSP